MESLAPCYARPLRLRARERAADKITVYSSDEERMLWEHEAEDSSPSTPTNDVLRSEAVPNPAVDSRLSSSRT